MSATWNGDAMARQVKEEAARRLQRAAVFFTETHKRLLSVSNPRPYVTPSVPGEYPRKRTGNAIGNVLWGPTDVAGILSEGLKVRAGVMANARYLLILEFARQRLGFLDTLKKLKPQLEAILLRKA